ncbi:MAG: protein kinase [Deltaproteobacteria bacterium]|nr:protein kinase [Deltaproteobacteria bacterium]
MSEDSPRMLGRYQLLGSLATGGMAEIHLARQTGIKGFEKLVVVKTVLKHLAKQERFLEMFFDEARIAAQLNHPNIIQIFDLGQEGDDYFMAMEYLEGESLGYLVKEARKAGKIMPVPIACKIVIEVCKALGYAHAFHDVDGKPLHIVHRDVSPHNIIVLFSGRVKLVDFGIAKAESQMHHTQTGTLKGKLSYMSPEQARSTEVDARSDIFAAGIVLWELLCRRRLFKRDTAMAVISTIVNDPVPPVREIRPELSEELDAIVMRALAKDPDERYQSADELARALGDEIRKFAELPSEEDVAAFVGEVLADRARTKRKLLEEIRVQGAGSVSLGVLKPQTDESLPSASKSGGALHAETTIRGQEKTRLRDSAKPRRAHWPIGLMLVLAIGLGGLGAWWALRGEADGASAPRADEPVGQPAEPAEPAEPVAKPAEPVAEPAEPAVKPAEPAVKPAEPAVKPAEPAVKPAEPGPKPTKPAIALLAVRSRPAGCEVRIDGKPLPGRTPMDAIELSPGARHAVTVQCEQHIAQTKHVTLRRGKKSRLSFAPSKKAVAVKKAEPGLLRLETEPWSEVFLGKKRLGMTPLLGLELPAGKHTLTAINSKLKIEKRIPITIQAGKTTSLYVELGN